MGALTRDLGPKFLLLLALSLLSTVVLVRSFRLTMLTGPEAAAGADVFFYYFRAIPPGFQSDEFVLREFLALLFPLVAAVLLAGLFINQYSVAQRLYSLPRYGSRRRWLWAQFGRLAALEIGFIVTFDLLFYLVCLRLWGTGSHSGYNQSFGPPCHGAPLAYLLLLALRQGLLLTWLALLQLAFSLRNDWGLATLASLIFISLNLFAACLNLYTPFGFTFAGNSAALASELVTVGLGLALLAATGFICDHRRRKIIC